MTPQEKARQRNWTKMRLTGFYIRASNEFMTNDELDAYVTIKDTILSMLDRWEENSAKLGFKVRPKKSDKLW